LIPAGSLVTVPVPLPIMLTVTDRSVAAASDSVLSPLGGSESAVETNPCGEMFPAAVHGIGGDPRPVGGVARIALGLEVNTRRDQRGPCARRKLDHDRPLLLPPFKAATTSLTE
jgi:hypothetical protein